MKPHIKKVNGMWCCNGFIGVSPAMAYLEYMQWQAMSDIGERLIGAYAKELGKQTLVNNPKPSA